MAINITKTSYLPNNYWGDVVAYVIYLLNRCPTKSVKEMTPYEQWSGRKFDLSHLKAFGCIASACVP